MKKCIRCNKLNSLSEFSNNSKTCNTCSQKRKRKYEETKLENKIKESNEEEIQETKIINSIEEIKSIFQEFKLVSDQTEYVKINSKYILNSTIQINNKETIDDILKKNNSEEIKNMINNFIDIIEKSTEYTYIYNGKYNTNNGSNFLFICSSSSQGGNRHESKQEKLTLTY